MLETTNLIPWPFFTGAFLLPFLVHLLSNKKHKIRKVGSVQFIQEKVSDRAHSIFFNEKVLFFLRVFILLLLIFLLMGFSFRSEAKKTFDYWVIIQPGIENHPQVKKLKRENTELDYRYLSYGFPSLSEPKEVAPFSDYVSVLNTLDDYSVEKALIISSQQDKRFLGTFRVKNTEINWLPIPEKKRTLIQSAFFTSKDTLNVLFVETSGYRTSFHSWAGILDKKKNIFKSDRGDLFVYDSLGRRSIGFNPKEKTPLEVLKKKHIQTVGAFPSIDELYFRQAVRAIKENSNQHIVYKKGRDTTKVGKTLFFMLKGSNLQEEQLFSEQFFKKENKGYLLVKSPSYMEYPTVINSDFVTELSAILTPLVLKEDFRIANVRDIHKKGKSKPQNKKIRQSTSFQTPISLLCIALVFFERFYAGKRLHG